MNNPAKPRFQHILTRGLKSLYSIAQAQTYKERTDALYEPFPKLDRHFLYWALGETNLRSHNLPYTTYLGNFTFSQRETFIKPAFFVEDSDTGPKEAWLDAHRVDTMPSWVYSERDQARAHREWGYVMWDRARVQHFDLDYRGRVFRRRDESQKKKESVRRSWPRRAEVHLAGGRGWWSEGNESKVLWISAASPWDDKEARGRCKYCIGAVRCAPHRICLRVPEEKALLSRSFELGLFKIPITLGASEDRMLQGPNFQPGDADYTPAANKVHLEERMKYKFEAEEEGIELGNEDVNNSPPQHNMPSNVELDSLFVQPPRQVLMKIMEGTDLPVW